MNYQDCPIMRTLEVIGGKWKPILLHLLEESPRRSGELGRLIPEASAKVITQQLRELERDGIVVRTIHSQVPPRVDYSLSPLGQTLCPLLDAMCQWGRDHPAASKRTRGRDLSLAKRASGGRVGA